MLDLNHIKITIVTILHKKNLKQVMAKYYNSTNYTKNKHITATSTTTIIRIKGPKQLGLKKVFRISLKEK